VKKRHAKKKKKIEDQENTKINTNKGGGRKEREYIFEDCPRKLRGRCQKKRGTNCSQGWIFGGGEG